MLHTCRFWVAINNHAVYTLPATKRLKVVDLLVNPARLRGCWGANDNERFRIA